MSNPESMQHLAERFMNDGNFREQMLVLKSEDFFERTPEVLKRTLSFLGLPDWTPEAWEIFPKGNYDREMAPATRRQLEAYFEPHNRRLYDYLGVDFDW